MKLDRGIAPKDALMIAFVQGAKFWEYHKTGATMWHDDQQLVAKEAKLQLSMGYLGKPSFQPKK